MKYMLSILLCGLITASSCFGVTGNDIRITQRDSGNTADLVHNLNIPASGIPAIMGLNGSTTPSTPKLFLIGNRLSFDGSSLNVSGLTINDITDATTLGKDIVTSSTGANVRSLIGAGTSNFSGNYNDLSNKPTLFSGAYGDLINKPTLFSGDYEDLFNKPVWFDGSYDHLTDKPTLGSAASASASDFATAAQGAKADTAVQPVAGKGLSTEDYTTDEKTKLSSIAANATANSSDAFLRSRSNHTGTQLASTISNFNATVLSVAMWDNLIGKPDFAPVALTGDYNDIINAPALFSGSYNDLTDTPTIPSAQVNVDWNASSGVTAILNKPTLFSGAYNDLTGKPSLFSGSYNDLNNLPTLFSGSYSDLTNKPTLFSGSYNDLSNKPTIPTVKLMQTTRVQTDSSGNYTWTYTTPFGSGVVPRIIAIVETSSGTTDVINAQVNGTPTNTQCVIKVNRTSQSAVALLGLTILSVPGSVGAQWVTIYAIEP